MDEPRVKVVRVDGRKFLQLRWMEAGREVQKSARTTKKRDAERLAAIKTQELEKQMLLETNGWAAIHQRFMDEHVLLLAPRTQTSYKTALNRYADCTAPETSADLTSENLVRFVSECQMDELVPKTIKGYLTHLGPLWKHCVEWGYIEKLPKAKLPRASNSAKGRPLTVEEFERYLAAIPKVVKDPSRVLACKQDATILWYSGLRLSDALELEWGGSVALSIRGIDRQQPMLWVPENVDKSRRESLIPLTPDFVEYLRTQISNREGFVLQLLGATGKRMTRVDTVSKLFAKFGKVAGVISGRNHRGDSIYASAHDLRRSFGDRWAAEVEAVVLQKLMRHKSINTTLTYYASVNAHKIGEKINASWERNKAESELPKSVMHD